MQHQQNERDILVRKNGKFFLMKNSNTNQNYQNHSYFNKNRQQKQSEANIRSQLKKAKFDRQFVDGSASFGIDNAYKYLWNKSDIKERLKAQWKERVQSQQTRYQKSTNLQALAGSASVQREPRSNFRISVKRTSHGTTRRRIKTQMTNKSPSLLPSLEELERQSISFPIWFVYSTNIKTYEQISRRTLELNFSHYLIRLFIKCKINWRNLESLDFYEILRVIKIARECPQKIDFSAKDIVNMRTVGQIFTYMENYEEGSNEWLGTVRYFFLPNNSKIQEFIFEQFKDEMKMLTTSKLNIEFQANELHFYNFQTGAQLKSMFDFLSCNRVAYDSSIVGFKELKGLIKLYDEHRMFQERIKRWKSIVPLDQEAEKDNQKKINIKSDDKNKTFLTLDQGSYNKLYERYKIKHAKFLGKPKKGRQAKSQWIERQKLIKNPDIFE